MMTGHDEQAMSEKIVAFPLAGRRHVIRRSATELEAVHGEAALDYWRSACRSLAAELRAIGCDEEDIRLQVMDFQTEVQLEMMRRYTERLDTGTDACHRVRT